MSEKLPSISPVPPISVQQSLSTRTNPISSLNIGTIEKKLNLVDPYQVNAYNSKGLTNDLVAPEPMSGIQRTVRILALSYGGLVLVTGALCVYLDARVIRELSLAVGITSTLLFIYGASVESGLGSSHMLYLDDCERHPLGDVAWELAAIGIAFAILGFSTFYLTS